MNEQIIIDLEKDTSLRTLVYLSIFKIRRYSGIIWDINSESEEPTK